MVKEEKKKRKVRRKYDHLKVEYINGNKTLKELAKRDGINYTSVQQIAAKEGWTEERNRLLDRVTEKTFEIQVDTRVQKIKKFNDDCLKIANNLLAGASKVLNVEVRKDPPSAVRLTRIAKTVKEAQYIGRLAMGISTENIAQSINQGEVEIKSTMEPKEAIDLYIQMIENVG